MFVMRNEKQKRACVGGGLSCLMWVRVETSVEDYWSLLCGLARGVQGPGATSLCMSHAVATVAVSHLSLLCVQAWTKSIK